MDEQRRQLEEARDDAVCKCGHPRTKHVFLRGRCATNCGCVTYEPKPQWSLASAALDAEDELELARKEITRLRIIIDGLMDDAPADEQKLREEIERLRDGLRRIAGDPASTRASVQAQVFRLLRL